MSHGEGTSLYAHHPRCCPAGVFSVALLVLFMPMTVFRFRGPYVTQPLRARQGVCYGCFASIAYWVLAPENTTQWT